MEKQPPEQLWVWRDGSSDWTDIVSAHHKPFHFISKERLVEYIRKDAIDMSHVDKAEAWDAIAAKNREIAELRAENASLKAQLPASHVGFQTYDEPGKITPAQFSEIVARSWGHVEQRLCCCEDCASLDPFVFIFSEGNYYCGNCYRKKLRTAATLKEGT